MSGSPSYVALSGGIGGAKLSLGLARLMGSDSSGPPARRDRGVRGEGADPRLTIIVNTGDDFEHLGLYVSPDVDTALYTLGGTVNPGSGWGRSEETWSFMQAIAELGGPTWFKLGDRDLATHIERTRRLRAGETLTSITAHLAERLGVGARVLPMADDRVRTVIEIDTGTLAFQEYFVREQCRPVMRRISYDGASAARPTAEVLKALAAPDLAGIIICPSNPWLSIDPILAVPGLREAMRASGAPVIAVSPIIGGKAVKGPTAKIMSELGITADALSIARHYGDLIDGLVLDRQDAHLANRFSVGVTVAPTLMRDLQDKVALAGTCLAFCDELAKSARSSATHRRAAR